jgi:hypothetical protein
MRQGRNNGRNRSRSDVPRNPRPPDSGGQGGGQSQWQRKYEHYCTLAQATNAGDGVTREQHWQNAEHFLRLINGSAT